MSTLMTAARAPEGLCRQTAGRPSFLLGSGSTSEPPETDQDILLSTVKARGSSSSFRKLIPSSSSSVSWMLSFSHLAANIGGGGFLFIHLSLSPPFFSKPFYSSPSGPSVPTVTISRSDLPDAWSCLHLTLVPSRGPDG